MGVTSCGKSTVAIGVAKSLGATFLEGDDLHPTANIEKMSKGIPLTDEDRLPWLVNVAEQMKLDASGVVASCSALKRSYRDELRAGVGQDILFVHLAFAKSLIAQRLQQRQSHFMNPNLLQSQFDALEPLAADERAIKITSDASPNFIVERVLEEIRKIEKASQ